MKLTSSWPERKPTIKSNLRVFLEDVRILEKCYFFFTPGSGSRKRKNDIPGCHHGN